MKKLTMALSLIASCAASSEIIPIKNDYHRLYVEPDLSWNLAYKFKVEEDITLKQWGLYYGINLGYEYTKPNYLYAGIDAFLSAGSQFAELRDNTTKIGYFEGGASKNRIEGRIGYCIKGSDFSLTPFSGAGGYFLSQEDVEYDVEHLDIAYIPLGLKAEYQWNHLTIGLKGEQMHFLHSWQRAPSGRASTNVWSTGSYGYEVSIPISFQTEVSGGKWYGAVEPYFLKLFNDLSFVGGRISAIHHF